MLDENRILSARAQGICFICSMCKHWHEGEDQGLKDEVGETICNSTNGCCGPIWGGDFNEYTGPLGIYKHKHCYLCGESSTHHIWAKNKQASKLGVCKKHSEKVKGLTARELQNGA